MSRCCCVSGRQIVDWTPEEVLVGSGRVKGWMRPSVKTLRVHSKAHVIALVGILGPCRHLRSSESEV
jgi:hypothetical protein